MACETGSFFCLVRDHASAMIRFPSPPVRGRMPSHGRMHALVAQGIEHRIPDPGVARSNRVRGTSGPSPSGRASRPQREGRGFEPRRLHDMRHAAACKRRHSEERRHVKTARPRDGIRRQRPPAGRARDGGAGRPVHGPARADVVQRQHACFPSRRPRVRTPSSAPSGKPEQWIRSTNGTRSRPFHVDASGENMDEQPRHGRTASRTKACHCPGSSEEEQVPFKHWVRIS